MSGVTTKRYPFRVIVRGSGEFPIDMLRYDRLTPHNQTDSAEIHGTELAEPRDVNLYREAELDWKPTYARWRSFGWEVKACWRDFEPVYED